MKRAKISEGVSVFRETFSIQGKGFCDIIDITDSVSRVVSHSGYRDGIVSVFVPGSTAGITTIEYESGLVADLKETFEKIAPAGQWYNHDKRWGDGNGFSHIRASLIGPGLAVPVIDGTPALGTWQQIVCIDFDNRARLRSIVATVVGS